jgi:hypothetical protein
MTLTEYLNKCLELSERASPGDWRWEGGYLNWLEPYVISASHDGGFASPVKIKKADAEFIAFSRDAVPKLCEALRIAVEALQEMQALDEQFRMDDDTPTHISIANEATANISKLFDDADGG